ncbi:hypothetical protein L5D93_23275 [Paenibacillus thiaminolyticus]|nr:hypothetical protein [Paenibacillus thiaminolyticus]
MHNSDYTLLITALAPVGNDTFDKEPFAEFYRRVGNLLPNVPKCVFENWIYRHYSDIDDYAFLDFRKMRFEKELWVKDAIYNNVNSYEDNRLIDSLGYQIYERNNHTWLQKYMLQYSTWPVPIIVYENSNNLDISQEKDRLLDFHEVWKVTLP